MTYLFPSLEWSTELMLRLNADAKFKSVGSRWEGEVNLYVEGAPGVGGSQVIYIDSWHGTCRRVRFRHGRGCQARPRSKSRRRLPTGSGSCAQEIGPIQAMISGQIRVYGNMVYILRNVGGTQRMVEVAATIPTQFPT